LIGTLVERRPDKLKRIRTENHSFPTDYLFFTFRTFGLIQKYQKIKASQKWLKTGERFGWKKRRLLQSSST
jgi:hypothetical protein